MRNSFIISSFVDHRPEATKNKSYTHTTAHIDIHACARAELHPPGKPLLFRRPRPAGCSAPPSRLAFACLNSVSCVKKR